MDSHCTAEEINSRKSVSCLTSHRAFTKHSNGTPVRTSNARQSCTRHCPICVTWVGILTYDQNLNSSRFSTRVQFVRPIASCSLSWGKRVSRSIRSPAIPRFCRPSFMQMSASAMCTGVLDGWWVAVLTALAGCMCLKLHNPYACKRWARTRAERCACIPVHGP